MNFPSFRIQSYGRSLFKTRISPSTKQSFHFLYSIRNYTHTESNTTEQTNQKNISEVSNNKEKLAYIRNTYKYGQSKMNTNRSDFMKKNLSYSNSGQNSQNLDTVVKTKRPAQTYIDKYVSCMDQIISVLREASIKIAEGDLSIVKETLNKLYSPSFKYTKNINYSVLGDEDVSILYSDRVVEGFSKERIDPFYASLNESEDGKSYRSARLTFNDIRNLCFSHVLMSLISRDHSLKECFSFVEESIKMNVDFKKKPLELLLQKIESSSKKMFEQTSVDILLEYFVVSDKKEYISRVMKKVNSLNIPIRSETLYSITKFFFSSEMEEEISELVENASNIQKTSGGTSSPKKVLDFVFDDNLDKMNLSDALLFLDNLIHFKLSPTISLYNRIIYLYGTEGQFEKMFQTIEEMESQNIIPDENSYIIVIEALVNSGHVEEAIQVFTSIENYSFEPNVKIIEPLVCLFIKNTKKISEYKEKWIGFVRKQKPLNSEKEKQYIAEYDKFILSSLVKNGSLNDSINYWDEIKSESNIHCFYAAKNIECLRALVDLEEQLKECDDQDGEERNSTTLKMIQVYDDLIETTYSKMKEENIKPNSRTYTLYQRSLSLRNAL